MNQMMLDSRYDEDLSENSFYLDLKSEHNDLISKAVKENWIICVPRADSYQRSNLTRDDFFTHILVPNSDQEETNYRTLSGKPVTIRNKVITVEEEDVACSNCTHVIFEEIFYTREFFKYKVWCIECPLNRSTFYYDSKNGSFNSVTTLRDCIDLLWTETIGKGILEQLDLIIDEFLVKNYDLEKCTLQILKDLSCTLYAKCLQTTLQDCRLRERTAKSKHLLDNVKIAIESYIQHKIYKKIFINISVCTAIDDSSLNKIIRNLYDIQLRDLNISSDIYDRIPCAKRELAKINGYSTILGKVGCLRHTLTEISKRTQNTEINYLSTDDLLPIFVFLVLKTNIPNWIANLVFLKQFQFTASSNDDSNYLITTLEASIEHIRSGILTGPTEPECQIFENQLANIDSTQLKIPDDSMNNVTFLFEQIRLGNYETVKDILQKNIPLSKNIKELCHPLCSCDKCERLVSINFCDTTATVFSCDDRGFTALHVACMYGKPQIVELLLESKANIQSCDYSGASPLHYAAMRGHQNALLLLLHSDADINAVDSEKCTALHFACNNGHETCVKAMLYFSEHRLSGIQINLTNNLGNTALHNAAKWGYESIVQILLEYGSDPTIENKQKKTALDYAHNLNIYSLMLNTKRRPNERIKPLINAILPEKKQINLDFEKENISQSSSIKEMKKVDLLLKAVAYEDMPLICYYLGLLVPDNHTNISQLCHPLCNCEKCEQLENFNNEKSQSIQNINVCNSEGFTALHVACLHGKTEIVRLLLNNGASVNLATRKGLAPLHLACQTQRNEIITLLLRSQDCNVSLQDTRGNTPLHYACFANDLKIAEVLVARGANVHLKNFSGRLALNEEEMKCMKIES